MRRLAAAVALLGAVLFAGPAAAATPPAAAAAGCGGCQIQWDEPGANRVTATFVVPDVDVAGTVAIWVGVIGVGGSLVQTGIILQPGGGEGFWQEWDAHGATYAYSEWGVFTPATGDVIRASVVPRPDGSWSMRLTDVTQDNTTWQDGDMSWAGGPSDTVIKVVRPNAVWAVEDPEGDWPLLDFGTLQFDNAWPAMHAAGAGLEYPGGCMTTTGRLAFEYLAPGC